MPSAGSWFASKAHAVESSTRTAARQLARRRRGFVRGSAHWALKDVVLAIPTAGDRSAEVEELIAVSRIPATNVIIIRTRAAAPMPAGVTVLDDLGPINIQRWWNLALRHARHVGAPVVIVANDDIRIGPDTLQMLVSTLQQTGATLASPGREDRVAWKGLPLHWYVDGALWAMRLEDGFWLDERFTWWMGERDLEVRARVEGYGVATCQVEFDHDPGSATSTSFPLTAASRRDMAEFGLIHPLVTRAMRLVERLS